MGSERPEEGRRCVSGHGDDTDGLRYMDNPTKDNYSVDNYVNYPQQTEVHGSSGIANNAFYQLASTEADKIPNSTSKIAVDGIGVEKAGKIWMRALVYYLTPNATFSQARAATVRAATDIHGADSTEVKRVHEAWQAVGVEMPEARTKTSSPALKKPMRSRASGNSATCFQVLPASVDL